MTRRPIPNSFIWPLFQHAVNRRSRPLRPGGASQRQPPGRFFRRPGRSLQQVPGTAARRRWWRRWLPPFRAQPQLWRAELPGQLAPWLYTVLPGKIRPPNTYDKKYLGCYHGMGPSAECLLFMFTHAQGEAAAYCLSNGMSPISLEPNLQMFTHAQGEAAVYCRSNSTSPFRLEPNLQMFTHAQGEAAVYCRSNSTSPFSLEPNLQMFTHAQGEAAGYCHSNSMSPISLEPILQKFTHAQGEAAAYCRSMSPIS
jgi:hypothetical protein